MSALWQRFWSKVKTPTGPGECWQWQGMTGDGYGRFIIAGKRVPAHRLAYESILGVVSPCLVIDHLCRNRACVNPYHMEAVTNRENLLRGETIAANNSKKTHCPKGHAYTEDNLDKHEMKTGQRYCKTCKNAKPRKTFAGIAETERRTT